MIVKSAYDLQQAYPYMPAHRSRWPVSGLSATLKKSALSTLLMQRPLMEEPANVFYGYQWAQSGKAANGPLRAQIVICTYKNHLDYKPLAWKGA